MSNLVVQDTPYPKSKKIMQQTRMMISAQTKADCDPNATAARLIAGKSRTTGIKVHMELKNAFPAPK